MMEAKVTTVLPGVNDWNSHTIYCVACGYTSRQTEERGLPFVCPACNFLSRKHRRHKEIRTRAFPTKFVTLKMAAKILCCSTVAIYQLVRRGRLRAWREYRRSSRGKAYRLVLLRKEIDSLGKEIPWRRCKKCSGPAKGG